jgi:hypothetical protein
MHLDISPVHVTCSCHIILIYLIILTIFLLNVLLFFNFSSPRSLSHTTVCWKEFAGLEEKGQRAAFPNKFRDSGKRNRNSRNHKLFPIFHNILFTYFEIITSGHNNKQ